MLLLFVGAGLILSGSVGALLAAGAATFVWFAFQRSSVQSVLVFTALALCVVGVITDPGDARSRDAPGPLRHGHESL